MSDIHLEHAPCAIPQTDADVVVLAGDIGEGAKGVAWAGETFQQPVIYVCGNHEYHDPIFSMGEHLDAMKEAAADSNVTLLDNEQVVMGGVRFLGTTMWTDVSDFGSVLYCDYDNIFVEQTPGSAPVYFSIDQQQQRFEQNFTWLISALKQPFNGKTVVITHHAPSLRSVHPQYMSNPWNPCFITDLEELMPGVDLWVHGHTHNTFDYRIADTRVVCNPRGYPHALGGWENSSFNSAMFIGL